VLLRDGGSGYLALIRRRSRGLIKETREGACDDHHLGAWDGSVEAEEKSVHIRDESMIEKVYRWMVHGYVNDAVIWCLGVDVPSPY
jgi:hypothetical protein